MTGRRGRLARRGAAVLLVLGLVYAGLGAASALSRSPRQQVAALGEVEALAGPAGPEAERLAAAARAVRRARRSTLGLFPTYDAAGLDAAADALAAAAEGADGRSWVSQEARLALGRVLLYRARDAEAARVLGGLVREGGYRGPAARRLLDIVRAGTG